MWRLSGSCAAMVMCAGASPAQVSIQPNAPPTVGGPVSPLARPAACDLARAFQPLALPVFGSPVGWSGADFDGDGDTDLALGEQFGGAFTLLLRRGAAFAPAQAVPVGPAPRSLVAADFDSDGAIELAVALFGATSIELMRWVGGAFTPLASLPAAQSSAELTAANLDGDATPDLLALSTHGPTGYRLQVWLNSGGVFSAPITYSLSGAPSALRATDLDGDGDVDVAVALHGSNAVWVFRNNGSGALALASTSTTAAQPSGVDALDVDSDGDLDLVVACDAGNQLGWLRNNGSTLFAPSQSLGFLAGCRRVVSVDWNADGVLDVAALGGGRVHLYENTGATLVYFLGAPFGVDQAGRFGALDLDADGRPELVLTDSIAGHALVADPQELLEARSTWHPSVSGGTDFALADFDGDGLRDIVMTAASSDGVSVRRGSASFGFSGLTSYSIGTFASAVAVADFDGDGRRDFVVTANNTSRAHVFLGSGALTFSAQPPLDTGISPESVAAADFDGDGRADFATANGGSNDVSVVLASPGGGFQPPLSYPIGQRPARITAADIDRNGSVDLVLSCPLSDEFALLRGAPGGGFAPVQRFATGDVPMGITTADFDGDGDLDVAVACLSSTVGRVALHTQLAGGGFAPAQLVDVGAGVNTVCAADFDGDGDKDLAAVAFARNRVALLRNDAGSFTWTHSFGVGPQPLVVRASDLERDSDFDLVVLNSQGSFTRLVNRCR